MFCGQGEANFQGRFCCLRPPITCTLLLFSRNDSPALLSLPPSLPPSVPPSVFGWPGVVCAGEELGERAPETSQSQHCNSSGWEQGWSGQQESTGLPGQRPVNLSAPTIKRLCERRGAGQTNKPPSPLFSHVSNVHTVSLFLCTGCTVIRRRQQLTFHGDVCQNLYERERDLHGHRWVTAPPTSAACTATRRQSILIFIQRWTERLIKH